jgi:hypothetical protein
MCAPVWCASKSMLPHFYTFPWLTTDLSKGLWYIILSSTGFLNFGYHIAFQTEHIAWETGPVQHQGEMQGGHSVGSVTKGYLRHWILWLRLTFLTDSIK